MPAYEIVLFLHLLALLAATAAAAIVKLAAKRSAAAATLRESMEWARLLGNTSRVFPIAVVVLVATGSYMAASRWGWGQGWIEAGFLGSFILLANGAFLGRRGAMRARVNVARLKAAKHELPNDAAPDRLTSALSEANTGVALAIACVMTVKPGLAVSLVVLGAGAALGALPKLIAGRASDLSDTSEFEAA